jgi:D-sedoheptulose 7-phosphate isomerase
LSRITWTASASRSNGVDLAQLEAVSNLIDSAYREGRFVFIIGNGGPGANASHFCEDLAKATLHDFENQKRLKS